MRRLLPMLVALLLPVAARAEVVDRVVVVVGDQLVLESEVRLEAVLSRLDSASSPFWSPFHGDPLHRLVDAAVIRSSAGELTLYEPSDESVRERLEGLRLQFRDRASWEAFLAEWGLDEVSLLVVLRRRMIVERFLSRNLHVPDNDSAAWLNAAEASLDQLRQRYKIRHIPQRGFP